MLKSVLSERKFPFLDGAIRYVRRTALLWIPYTLFWLPLTIRFIPLVLLEAVYNLYLFFFSLPQTDDLNLLRVVKEGKGNGVAIVTGGTSGIGKEITRALILAGYHVHLPVRNMEKAEKVVSELGGPITLYKCDLDSIQDVCSFAEKFKSTHSKLDLLISIFKALL